jgi:hypothetical protein
MEYAKSIIGTMGPVILDVGIVKHYNDNSDDDEQRFDNRIDLIRIGRTGRPITFDDVFVAIYSIYNNSTFRQLMNTGQSYFFEGIEIVDGKGKFFWGT